MTCNKVCHSYNKECSACLREENNKLREGMELNQVNLLGQVH